MTLNALADHLDELARQTWYNLTHARRLGIRMGEVTITEANLLSIAKFVEVTGLRGDLVPTKANEAVTGTDFEIWMDIGGVVLGYTIQAKVMAVNNASFSYREIGKTDKAGTEQAALLEHHAITVGAFPFYVLFNGWSHGSAGEPTLPSHWPAEHLGCVAVAAPEVRRIRNRWPTMRTCKANDFLPSSIPWSELFRLPSRDGHVDGGSGTRRGDWMYEGSAALRGDDLTGLAEQARERMGGQRDFGGADRLPDYVLRAFRTEEDVAEQATRLRSSDLLMPEQHVPQFAIVIRER